VALLIRNLAQLVSHAGQDTPLRGAALGEVAVLENAYLLAEGGRIVETGRMRDLRPRPDELEELDGRGLCALPGLVDCHTHACFAGDRV
jgi:imidazolonepropionase